MQISNRSAIYRPISLQIVFVFVSPYDVEDVEFGKHIIKHGDGVKDISFDVEDLDVIVETARARGGKIVDDIWEESDEFGVARFATVQTVSLIIKIPNWASVTTKIKSNLI